MISLFDPLRGISFFSVLLRLVLAVICGGLVGAERSYKRRTAGFRTHILTCLGAAMTTMTSEYLIFYMNYHTDVARLGAQVISGIGFIGAGTIIVSHRYRVKGLTTADGFWATAIVGLALGFGYYEAAIATTIMIMAVEQLLIRIEYKILSWNPEATLYVESLRRDSIEKMLQVLQDKKIIVRNIEINQLSGSDKQSVCAILNLRLSRGMEFRDLIRDMEALDGIVVIEEL